MTILILTELRAFEADKPVLPKVMVMPIVLGVLHKLALLYYPALLHHGACS